MKKVKSTEIYNQENRRKNYNLYIKIKILNLEVLNFINNEVIIYKDGELELQVEVTPDKETVWLRVEEMAELFNRDRSVIQRHIKNIFKEDELE